MERELQNGFEIIASGAQTTVQDFGRVGYANMGITASGAVDRKAMEIANLLVGNCRKEAVLESTLIGPTLVFHVDSIIALTGADMQAKLSGESVEINRPVAVHAGDCLQLGIAKSGCRGYIAFAGGMVLPEVLGSKSLHLRCGIGGGFGRALCAGDQILLHYNNEKIHDIGKQILERNHEKLYKMNQQENGKNLVVRVVLGPQEDYFTESAVKAFLEYPYKVSNDSNRMACKLTGPYIDYHNTTDIISDGIALGSIQVSPNGQPIVMLVDRQTTGGYAKIATVISIDIPILAQCKPGDDVQFQAVSLHEAQRCYRKEEKEMRRLEKKYGLQ